MATRKVYLHHGDIVEFYFVPDDYHATATDFKEAYVRPELFTWGASVTNEGIHIFDPSKSVKKIKQGNDNQVISNDLEST